LSQVTQIFDLTETCIFKYMHIVYTHISTRPVDLHPKTLGFVTFFLV